jgi:hypothetical protein
LPSRCNADACQRRLGATEDVRAACGIRRVLVPPHLYPDQPYDTWGNPVLPNGERLKGELFHDASVQKVLAQGRVLGLFTSPKAMRLGPVPEWLPCVLALPS